MDACFWNVLFLYLSPFPTWGIPYFYRLVPIFWPRGLTAEFSFTLNFCFFLLRKLQFEMDKFLAKEEFNQLGYRTSTAPARRVSWPWLWLQNCEILVTGVRLWQHLISCDVWFPTLNASRQISDEWRLQREEFQMQLQQFGDQYWNSSEFITFNIRSGEMCFSADEYLFF